MGFEFEDCQSALAAGNSTLESAVEWYECYENIQPHYQIINADGGWEPRDLGAGTANPNPGRTLHKPALPAT